MMKGTISPFTPWGTKIRYTGKNGYEINHENARKAGMKMGDVYTLRESYIGESHTFITLDEISGNWNSVMFEYADPDKFRDRIMREFGLDPTNHPGNISRNLMIAKIDRMIDKEKKRKSGYNPQSEMEMIKFISGKMTALRIIKNYIKRKK